MKVRLCNAALGAALAGVILLTGCPFMPKDDPDPPPPIDYFLDRVSPENLLANLKAAYKYRQVAEYESLLASNFTFVLSPEDAGQPGMPDQWGRNQEITIHQKMFDGELVQSLLLDFVVGDRIFDAADQLWTITITDVDLYLNGITPDHPTPTTYRVENGTAKFWFRQNDWIAEDTTERVWTIVKWEDMPIEGGGS